MVSGRNEVSSQAYFRPELLNRLDEVVVFRALGRRALHGIVNLLLEQTAARLKPRGIRLRLSPQLTAHLIEQGYEPVRFSSAMPRPSNDSDALQLLQDTGAGCVSCVRQPPTMHLRAQAYGARPLRRAVSRLVEDPLAGAILAGLLQEGDLAELGLDADGQVTVAASRPGPVYKSEIVSSGLSPKVKTKSALNISA